jgi:hypothetical protein
MLMVLNSRRVGIVEGRSFGAFMEAAFHCDNTVTGQGAILHGH